MNVLDENIIDNQRRQLMSWRIRIHQIGYEVGGMRHERYLIFSDWSSVLRLMFDQLELEPD